jgi:hypothetical protein
MIELLPGPEGVLVPQYAELALDPETFDIEVPFRWLLGAEAIAQRIRVRFQFMRGDWFLDERIGIDFENDILGKGRIIGNIDATFARVLRTTPGVQRVAFCRSTLDAQTRVLSTDFEAYIQGGSLLRAREEPFILPSSPREDH